MLSCHLNFLIHVNLLDGTKVELLEFYCWIWGWKYYSSLVIYFVSSVHFLAKTMASHLSTKDRLLSLIDDIELIAKWVLRLTIVAVLIFCLLSYWIWTFFREIIEVSIAPKSQKLSAADHAQLTDLLLAKDVELKKTLDLADEQAKIQQKMNELKAEVDNKVTVLVIALY